MIAISTIAWFFAALLMMGFFAGVEMAFYSVNRFGIELRKKQGRSDAILLSKYFENPELFLSTMLIGFTLFLVSFALLFTSIANQLWDHWGLKIEWIRVALNIVLATFIVLVFGEFIPRALFRAHSNIILMRIVWLINILYQILQPIARLFLAMADWTLKYIFNVRIRETKDNLSGGISETLFQQSDDPDFEPEDQAMPGATQRSSWRRYFQYGGERSPEIY
jgi:CBS domain containing-hemolysin-like protein